MITDIFEFYYTTNMHPARLKPLSKEELGKGMTADAVEQYLSLVEQLYQAFAFDVNAEFEPLSQEAHHQKQLARENVYNSLIKLLFKQDAISDDVYCELHKAILLEFNSVEHPGIPGTYISDSLDDFRLAFEYSIVENDPYIDIYREYLYDRYGYNVCVRPNVHSSLVSSKDLCVIRFEHSTPEIRPIQVSYWEVKQLLKTIQQDVEQNRKEQKRLDSMLLKPFKPQYYTSSLEKSTYPTPKTIGEWYTTKRALEVEADRLWGVEDEIRRIFDTMEKPAESAGSGVTLYIHKGNIRCRQQKHHIVPATAILCDAMDREVEIDVQYCTECDRYYLNYISYEYARERYGLLIGKLKMIAASGGSADFELASESPLKLCGYNVSQAEGLSTSTRQYLLAKIIHDGIMSKVDVVHYLEHFMNMNGAKAENALALDKWREDLDFVHKYNKDIQPKVYISEVKQY